MYCLSKKHTQTHSVAMYILLIALFIANATMVVISSKT